MIRRRVEQTDEYGRTVTTVVDEPEDAAVEASEDNAASGAGFGIANVLSTLTWLVGLAGITVLCLLGLRLSFETGSANRTNFVDFLYDITGPLVRPFAGIIEARTLDGGGIFEPGVLIAMGVYLAATALVMLTMLALASAASAPAARGPSVHHSRLVRGH